MNKKLLNKLKTLPNSPGVYFHKSAKGEIIYVGKAAVLKNRVRQYFQTSRLRDAKTDALVAEIADTDWMEVESEIDALFLESEMIKRYMPRYNLALRDDKSQIFVRLNMRDSYPYLSYTRQPLDDGAEYFGPYYNGWAVKKALRYLRRVFPYSTHATMPKRVCLQYHLGLCPGVEEGKISSADYKAILRKLIMYLKGERKQLVRQLESEMKAASAHQEFERAAKLRNQIHNLRELQKQIVFSDREFMDISKDQALAGLQQLLGLKGAPRRIEGYDISHMSGTNNVASMVVATNGVADKSEYRKFKMQIPGNNDFAHMHETMSRRFSGRHLDWPKPDLLLIDGGKGQLSAALDALEEKGVHIPAVGLAKREEQIVVHKKRSNVTLSVEPPTQSVLSGALGRVPTPGAQHRRGKDAWSDEAQDSLLSDTAGPATQRRPSHVLANAAREGALPLGVTRGFANSETDDWHDPYVTESEDFYIISLPHSSHIVKLLQRIRDESHRFAVSYHTVLKRQKQTASSLEEIPGIGPSTRKKLIKSFGSLRAMQKASRQQLVAVIGEAKTEVLWPYIAAHQTAQH